MNPASVMPMFWVTQLILAALLLVLTVVVIRSRRDAAALRASEDRLRIAVHVSDIGVFDHDHRTGEVYWSGEMCRLYGWPDDATPSLALFLERVHPDERAAVARAIDRAHAPQSEGLFDVQHRLVLPDGEIRWVMLRSVTRFEGDGTSRHAVRTVGTAIDFTERKRAEEALRQSEERLHQAVRVSQIGIYDHDQASDRIWWSPEQRQNYGFSPDEPVTLEKFVECVFPDDRAEIAAAVRRAHDPSGDGLFDVEHRIIRRDGQVRWLVTRSRTFFAGEGSARHPMRTVGAVLDVTDRRAAEERLRQREQIHSAFVSQSADGIALVDTESLRFVEFNDAACEMLGHTREALGSLTLPELAADAVAADRIRTQIASSGLIGRDLGLTALRRRDGSILPVWVTSRPVTHHNRVYLAVVWRDTTEREKAEHANRQLASLVRHAQEFIAISNLQGGVEFVNEFGRQLFGIGPDESLDGRTIPDFVHARHHERLRLEVMPALAETGHWSGRLDFRRRTGDTAVPMLTEGFRIDDADGRPLNFASVSRDITELVRADAQLRRLNSIHLTLSQTNEAIVRATSPAELLERVCQIAVEYAGFALVWVGLADQDRSLRTVAVAGPARAYLDGIRVTADERLPEGRGPSGEALRSGAHVIVNHFRSSERMRPWWGRAGEFGIESSAAFPLVSAGRVIGVLSVYSAVSDQFGELEVSLLDDMAADISFGLESLHRSAALDRSLEQIREVEAAARVGTFRLQLPQWSLWWSRGTPAVLGLPAATTADRASLETALGPEVASILSSALAQAAQSGRPIDIDLPVRASQGTESWIRLFGVPRRSADGTTEVSCTLQDISERKRLESEVSRAADAERRRLASELHDNLGQILFGLSLLLASIGREARTAGSPLADKIERTAAALNQAMQVCRTLAHGISPVLEGGLAAALAELAGGTAATGVDCVVTASQTANAMVTGARALELYRIAQEAITNALKHGRCRRIEVELAVRGSSLELSIRDDGAGVDLPALDRSSGIGLQTMRYRAARAGGTLDMRSNPGGGTNVHVRVPLLAEEFARPAVSSRP